jgi:hypothetical protein
MSSSRQHLEMILKAKLEIMKNGTTFIFGASQDVAQKLEKRREGVKQSCETLKQELMLQV